MRKNIEFLSSGYSRVILKLIIAASISYWFMEFLIRILPNWISNRADLATGSFEIIVGISIIIIIIVGSPWALISIFESHMPLFIQSNSLLKNGCIDEDGYTLQFFNQLLAGLVVVIIFNLVGIMVYFENDFTLLLFIRFQHFLINAMLIIISIIVWFGKREYIRESLEFFWPLQINVTYTDYKQGKIEDDEPHLKIGQSLTVSLKEVPRNKKEKRSVYVLNPSTPNKPALVTAIQNRYLANKVRTGQYILKVKLLEILDNARLKLELSAERKDRES